MDKQDFPAVLRSPLVNSDVPVRRIDVSSSGQGIWRVGQTVQILGAEELEGVARRWDDMMLSIYRSSLEGC